MFRFERYNEQDEEIWDDFVMEKSVNGTFLQTRRFLNYHPSMACERLPMSVIGSIWEETPIRQAGSVQR